MKLVIFLFFIISFSKANACNVEIFSKIYKLENSQTLSTHELIANSDCSLEVNLKITSIISNASGVLAASILEKEFIDHSVIISPRKISLFDLNTTLHDQLASNTKLFFINTQSMNQIKALSLNDGEIIKPVCENCNSVGEKNIKVEISNPISNTNRVCWFTTKLLSKVRAIKAKRNLSFQEKSLTKDDFYFDEILTLSPENVLTSLDNISFFRPNQSIASDSIIKAMDLHSVNLVSYGVPVKVVFQSQNIILSNMAMPTRSAQFGETVEIQTLNNKKKVLARVIDFNKVVIEL
jgi:flagella basal body P-ring formation protein FlgA